MNGCEQNTDMSANEGHFRCGVGEVSEKVRVASEGKALGRESFLVDRTGDQCPTSTALKGGCSQANGRRFERFVSIVRLDNRHHQTELIKEWLHDLALCEQDHVVYRQPAVIAHSSDGFGGDLWTDTLWVTRRDDQRSPVDPWVGLDALLHA